MNERERERERSTRHLYGGAALQLFVSIRHAGFISAVSACTKTLFFTTGPAGNMARLRCIHVDGPCIDSDCNCCVSLQITASRPSAPQPSPPPRDPITPSTVFPRSSVSLYRAREIRPPWQLERVRAAM